jgi:hypothetical protein
MSMPRVTNQDLDKRLTKLETEFDTVKSGIRWLLAMVSTALATGLAQFIRSLLH